MPKTDPDEKGAKIGQLRERAAHFQAAILVARDHFPRAFRRKFSAFPKSCCGHTSVLLALYLQNIGFTDVAYVFGGSRGPNVEDAHAWVEVGDIIVDITAHQFSDNPNPLIITEERSWRASFYQSRRTQEILSVFPEEARQNYREAYAAVLEGFSNEWAD